MWTNLWEPTYKSDSVHAILDSCDAVHVAVNSMQASMARCNNNNNTALHIIRTALDRDLAARCHTHVQATRAVLHEDLDSVLIDELLSGLDAFEGELPPTINHEDGENDGDAASKAAALALRSGAWALRSSIRRVGVVLSEKACLSSGSGRERLRRFGHISESIMDSKSPQLPPSSEQARRRVGHAKSF